MTAVAFMIWNRSRTSVLGVASVCLDARYASVRWAGAERLMRRHCDVETWRAIANELNLKLPAAALPKTSPIAKLLAGEHLHDVQVQYLRQDPIDGSDPAGVAELLDAGLRTTILHEPAADMSADDEP